ncbi:MAG: tRNA pseudouridine(55) synthase TruB [Bacteroidales bacterium]|nr:tRNA pseudouridine(55) synthase TruB [Bacteroidales bacterium]
MTAQELTEGTILLIDKPLRWSSFDVVNKVRSLIRKRLGISNIKVGHAGTLDPLATGLLVICTGKKTKTIEQLQASDKEYLAVVGLGHTTPSYDLETEFDAEFSTEHVSLELVEETLKTFIGEVDQVPPLFSAKMIGGKRAYKIARKGKDMQLPSQRIKIYELELLSFHNEELHLRIYCSKGTYIRSLAHDLGKALGCGGYLKALRRTKSGEYSLKDAISLEQFDEILLNLQPFPIVKE